MNPRQEGRPWSLVVPFAFGVLVVLETAACGPPSHDARSAPPPTQPPPSVTPGSLDGVRLLDEPRLRALGAGAGPASVVATGEASERERLGAFVDIPEGICLLAYARASSTVEDLDLAAFSDEGTPVAVDDAPDAHPTLLMCPPHPRRVYVAAVAASGEGLVAVGAQLVPLPLSATVGKVMSAHGTRTASSRAAEAWPGLEDHVRRHHVATGGTWEVFRKVAIAVDARVPAATSFALEADGCTDALVVPDDDVGGLEIEALDDRGRLIARTSSNSTSERDRTLTVCSEVAWTGSITVRPHVGQGLVAVVLSRGRGDIVKQLAVRADVAWAGAHESLERVNAHREPELRAAGYGAASGSETASLLVGSTRSVPIILGDHASTSRGCSRIDVFGGAPTTMIAASVWDEAGALVSSGEGPSGATVFACGRGRLRLDLEARARPGPYLATWRAERWMDPAFAAHPIAAARMLTRMASGRPALFSGEASTVRAFHVDAAHEVSWTEVVRPGDCVHVVAGAEGEGAGLVARVVDVGTGDELDRSHAMESVGVHACAPSTTMRTLAVTLAVTGGKLDVVVGERVLHAPPATSTALP